MLGSYEVIKQVLFVGNVIVIIGNVYEIILGLDFVTDLGPLYGFFDDYNAVHLEALLLEDSMIYTNGKVFGFDEGNKFVSAIGQVLGTILVNVDWITHKIGVGT